MPLDLFPAGGTKIGSGPFSIISHAFLPANKITANVVARISTICEITTTCQPASNVDHTEKAISPTFSNMPTV